MRSEAAYGDIGALASVAGNLHAGNALQRIGNAEIGKFIDVVGDDRIDNFNLVALYFLGRCKARALLR